MFNIHKVHNLIKHQTNIHQSKPKLLQSLWNTSQENTSLMSLYQWLHYSHIQCSQSPVLQVQDLWNECTKNKHQGGLAKSILKLFCLIHSLQNICRIPYSSYWDMSRTFCSGFIPTHKGHQPIIWSLNAKGLEWDHTCRHNFLENRL